MGSYCSCPDPIPDNHQSKFKVINVDDDGNELGSGVMELTEEELVLHTRSRESVRWPYLCLRRYGYDSNLFSFESGRRCQTGQGIFAFKCVRAEEIFNLLQDVMHSNSISVVEEPLPEPNHSRPESESPLTPPSPTTPGYAAPALPNGVPRLPSLGEASSHPSSRHPSVGSARLPSVGSARLPSVGEESTHPLLVTEETVHTYVNTSGVQEERRNPAPLEVRTPSPVDATPLSDDSEGQVLLEPEGVKFVLGPTPVQRQRAGVRPEKGGKGGDREAPALPAVVTPNGDVAPSRPAAKDSVRDGGECHGTPSGVRLPYEHLNGTAPAANPRRARPPFPALDGQNANNSAQRRTALLDYENLPALPPVWEARWPSSGGEDEDEELEEALNPKTSFLNGYHQGLDPAHNYVNTENVTVPLSAHKLDRTAPTIFDFDFRQKLNYIEVEMEKGSDSSEPQTPTTPLPQTPTRRNELYAIIDVERTAAMSSLQKALPRDDGTSRKTRHNSTDLPL